ncbi:hypothetical protein GVAV_001113 [Gurleya vavrai]
MLYKPKCNNILCRKQLGKVFLLTSCGHIFCTSCIQSLKQTLKCLGCNTFLKKDDLKIIESNYKQTLIGVPIDILFEEFSKAVNFYIYQITEDLEIYKAESTADIGEFKKENEYFRSEIEKIKAEKEVLLHKCKQLEERLEREKENSYLLDNRLVEKNKELQKMAECNEKLRFGLRSSFEGRKKG